MTLRDGLTALAEGARSYADADAAVRTVRRRRTVGLVVAPALVLAAVAALLILPGLRLGTGSPKDLTTAGPAPALPADRAVGRAAFAYTAEGRGWLVTRDGHRYALPPAAPDAGDTSLSPDGRWLVQNGLLRDLTGRAQHILQGQRVIAWSPDAVWILVEDSLRQQLVVQAATGRVDTVRSQPGRAVLDDGSVVVADGDLAGEAAGVPNVVTLDLLDPRDGAAHQTVVVDARSALVGSETVRNQRGIVRVWFGSGDRVLFEVAGGQPPTHCALLASLRDTGHVSAVPATADGQQWLPLGFVDDAVLVRSAAPTGPDPADQAPVELRAWRDGGSTPLFRLPPGSAVLAPGGAMTS